MSDSRNLGLASRVLPWVNLGGALLGDALVGLWCLALVADVEAHGSIASERLLVARIVILVLWVVSFGVIVLVWKRRHGVRRAAVAMLLPWAVPVLAGVAFVGILVAVDPKATWSAPSGGEFLLHQGRWQEAVAQFTLEIERDPKDAPAFDGRAFAYGSIGKYDDSIADASRAIDLDPNLARAYNTRAAAYRGRGDAGQVGWMADVDRVIADATRAIELAPNFPSAYFNRAVAYASKGQRELAVADLREVLRQSKDASLRAAAVELLHGLGEKD